MKLQHLRLAFCDEIKSSSPSPPSSSSSSLTVNFNCLWPTAAKKPESGDDCTEEVATSLELKSNFNSPKAANKIEVQNQEASPPGSTRWNPTHEQIRMLEELYKAGMRTPNAQQIERITAEIGKHGKIEGKNVFYWFQNHKARERQRKKRTAALLALDAAVPSDPVPILSLFSAVGGTKVEKEMKWSDDGKSKRKCRSWEDVGLLELDDKKHQQSDGTLELFPLRPESLRNNQTAPAPTLKNNKDIN